jgi:cell wall-associated NlpC family hydrolase
MRSIRCILCLFGVICMALPGMADARSIAQARSEVVAVTLDYLGIPYLWGGEHPQTGLDCSGFVQLVYKRAGLYLPRVAAEQFQATRLVSPEEVLPGDLIFYSMHRPGSRKVDHVGIYMGKGYFVHASVSNGIHIEPITKAFFLDRLVAIRKYRGF